MGRQRRVIKQKKPLIVICYEGANATSEKIYFSNFKNRDLRIQFSTGGSTDPDGMLMDLKNYIRNEDLKNEDDCTIFIVIDTDLNDGRISKIREINKKIKNENLDNFNIKVVTSAPTFEIWYLMHFRSNNLKFTSSKEVKKALNEILDGKYNETLNIYPYLKQNQEKAYLFAKKIDEQSSKNREDILNINPHSDVYKIIDSINSKKDL